MITLINVKATSRPTVRQLWALRNKRLLLFRVRFVTHRTILSHHDIYLTGTNPHWNSSMQFLIKDLHQDILCLTVFDRDLFSPDGEVNKTNHHHFEYSPRQSSWAGRRFVWVRSSEAARSAEAPSRGHSSCWRPSLASSQSSLTSNCFRIENKSEEKLYLTRSPHGDFPRKVYDSGVDWNLDCRGL